MRKVRAVSYAALVAAIGLLASASPAQELPAEAFADDVIMVARLDVAKCTPDALLASAKAILGEMAAMVEGQMLPVQMVHGTVSQLGVQSVVIVARKGTTPYDSALVLLSLGSSADEAKIKQHIEGLTKQGGTDLKFTRSGDWLLIHEAKQTFAPGDKNSAGAKAVAEGLRHGATYPLAVVSLTPESAKQEALAVINSPEAAMLPPALRQMAMTTMDARWSCLTVQLGDKPEFTTTFQMADESAAKKLADEWKSAMQQIPEMLKNPAMPVPPQVAGLAGTIIDSLKQGGQGSQFSITVDTAAMKSAVAAVAPLLLMARGAASDANSTNNMKQILLNVHNYADANGGKLPDTLDDLAPLFGDAAEFRAVMTNPRTGENPGYAYKKHTAKLTDFKNPSKAIILLEMKGGKPDPNGAKGFADGHVEPAGGIDVPQALPLPE